MYIIEITPNYSVSGQITPANAAEISAQGFRTVMCNRPDGESPDQPDVADVRAAAEAEGLAFAFVPVVSGNIRPDDIEAFKTALARLPGPVLAYCRSGTRCQNLWNFSR